VRARLLALLVTVAPTAVAATATRPVELAGAARALRAGIDGRGGFVVEVRAEPGDGWWRLAHQAGLDPARWRSMQRASGGAPGPRAHRWHVVPGELWPPGLGEQVVTTLFPEDRPESGGWRHVVTRRRINGRVESPWSIAALFTGDGRRHVGLGVPRRSLRPGDAVTIPGALVLAHLRPPSPSPEAGAAIPAPEPDEDVGAREPPEEPVAFVVVDGTRSDDGLLVYETDEHGPHASYRLKAGETLYSDVVLRFTGRLGGRYVNEAALRFAARSGVREVTDIPVGWRIRIPLEELRPEYLPPGHPRRREWEREQEESRRLSTVPVRRGLAGVHVLLDAGHGGRDPGSVSRTADVWEDDYAYDVKCRLMALLADRTHAEVHPLVVDASTGHAPLSRLTRDEDERLLTDPPLELDGDLSTRVAVNARWLLANDLRRRLLREGVTDDQLVFLSIHADSLHPSASGAMAYYPAARYRPERSGVPSVIERSGRSFAEARTANQFKMTRNERLQAEGRSRRLGEAIIEALRGRDIRVHGYSPVRGHVMRQSAWVPAVIRLNRVPTAVLFEACNLNNPEDQLALRDPAFRQQLAEALLDGIVAYFDGDETRTGQ
jgi:N-acetylmuramoyl-L-alanine amidase